MVFTYIDMMYFNVDYVHFILMVSPLYVLYLHKSQLSREFVSCQNKQLLASCFFLTSQTSNSADICGLL